MPHGTREGHPEGPIVPNKPIEEIREEPYTMPTGFEWSNVDVHNADDIQELYQLLANNYVEDDDALFRFDYSPEFLLWALQPPGSRADFVFGVRSASTQKLVAFISAVPATLHVYAQTMPVVEINFLCVHKKLRSKRLAPVLIKEITRRVNLTGTFQAVYTAGTVLPVPVSSARYHHRSLNPKKLVKVGFSRVGHRMTMARMQKLYKLPDAPETPGLRPMESKDVAGVHKLLTTYLQRFEMKIMFSEDEIRHWLLPREKVINSYVVTDDDGVVTDLLSFYHLPSSILNLNDTLFAAYSFYNVATTVPLIELMKDALILAKSTGSDVFNALNLMENNSFLEELKFGIGDGNLQYYIYNWACPEMPPDKVGIVLL
jgi:glycylpeptide N-tetradecanoyltransferase